MSFFTLNFFAKKCFNKDKNFGYKSLKVTFLHKTIMLYIIEKVSGNTKI